MADFDPTLPFALIDDARPGGTAQLFTGLRDVIEARTFAAVRPALAKLRAAGDVAGFIGFDAGYALEPRLDACGRLSDDGLPLLWFGVFARRRRLEPSALDALLGDHPARVGPLKPSLAEPDHAGMLTQIAALIASGDVYQVNATFPATVATSGSPLALYRRLRQGQAAPYGALVHTGAAWILSFSPELFFEKTGPRLTTRPMKGTAPRGFDRDADDAAAAALAADPKNRAENLMIVDLLRNDLARVAVPGTVAVPRLFEIERYPTLLQMTSTVTATAAAGIDAVDVLTALFPCGSVTGAPKLRAMEVIAATEPRPRGLYTGSIGWIGADGDAAFNVAIRTLVRTRPGAARIGLGSGIVADSVAADEWRECLAKAAFLARRPAPDLIETMRLDGGKVVLLPHHLARLAASAAFLGHRIDLDAVAAAVAAEPGEARLRLVIAPDGRFALQRTRLPDAALQPVAVQLVPLPVAADDWRLRHKTTDRRFYDDARRARQAFEVLFVSPGGLLTEGSFTSLFVPRDGRLLTPPLALGLLPGVLRAALIDTGRAIEAPLSPDDLVGGFFIGNALRGLLPAVIGG